MKKDGIMNCEISGAVARMGHGDEIMICGSAFPIPDAARRIDVALEPGLPSFMDVLRVVLKELKVEKIIVAEETKEKSPKRFKEITDCLSYAELDIVSQKELKKHAVTAKACIRTGECTPFSNVVLVSGVIF
jgi:D-ribose pyranase